MMYTWSNTCQVPIKPKVITRNIVGLSIGSTTYRNRCHRVVPSISAASTTSVGTLCSAARNMSMNVPAVVQTTSKMIAIIATLGPDSHSHQVRPRNELPVSASGGAPASQMPTASPIIWSTPRGSENHTGPSIPKKPSTAFTAPPPVNRKMKTRLTATELVTDGK